MKRKNLCLNLLVPFVLVVSLISISYAASIEPGETKTGNITSPDQSDSYSFFANVGDSVTILMGATSFVPWVELHAPDGTAVTWTWSMPATIRAQKVNQTGTYYIICRAQNGTSTGEYSVSLIKNPGSPNSVQDPDGGVIQSGETKIGTITMGDLDASTFSANVGDSVTILMGATSFVPWVELHAPDGTAVTWTWSMPATIRAQRVNQTGTYYIICRAQNGTSTGEYSVSLTVISGQTICSYSIFPTNQSFVSNGGTGSVNVTTQSGCAWSASSNVAWITITSGGSGSGSGTVSYSVSANMSTDSRSGTMTIAGQTFMVNQSGTACTYSISPPNQSFGSSGGTGSFSVTTQSGCTWSVVGNVNWITLTSGSSGSGSGTVTYSVSANSGTSSRSWTMTITGQTFTVNQSGTACTYSISPPNQSFGSSGGAESVNVTTQSGCSWSVVSNDDWIVIISGNSGSGDGTVSYSVSGNLSASSRTGTMTIAGQTFTVTQAELLGIAITSPNGGETWNTGTTQKIQWIYTGSPGSKVRIELLKGGAVDRVIKSSASIGMSGSGSYNWKIPSNQASGNDYKVRVTSTSNSSYTDTSNSNFSIRTPSIDKTVVGTWDIDGTMKVTVSIPGYGSDTEVVNFQDRFTFYPNGNFEMIDVSGTWSQTKNKVTVNLSLEDVGLYFEDYLGEYGLDVSVDATKATLTGTLQKNGTLKGPLAFNMGIYFYDLDTDGKVKVSGSFTGIRTGEVSSLQEGESSPPSSTPADMVVRQIINTIKDLNITIPPK